MPRSVRVRVDCIQRVKQAVRRNHFPRQQDLAEAVGLSKNTISSFLNGRPVDYLNFLEICQRLSLDWQEIAADLDDFEEGIAQDKTSAYTAIETISKPIDFDKNGQDAYPRSDKQPIFQVPYLRNPYFKGRDEILATIQGNFVSGQPVTQIQVLTGAGGFGKTQLAAEYAYRNKDKYDIVWWIRSEE
ncbi:MAG: helix-turn-helix transcriptional regulator, partial [Microcoleus sp. SIO2G3]|nr:helix-turn-helix transcriptional regulator [Microcoleus sp. SIO2G3]